MDISKEIPGEWENQFDAVASMDVLFHIVDDEEFTKALDNLSRLLHSGGWLIISDGFCSKPWGPFYHEYHRSFSQYQHELEKNGLEILHIEPVFYTMLIPICSAASSPQSLLPSSVRFFLKVVRLLASHRLTQSFNHIPGFFLFLLDAMLSRTSLHGPGIKILYAKKTAL